MDDLETEISQALNARAAQAPKIEFKPRISLFARVQARLTERRALLSVGVVATAGLVLVTLLAWPSNQNLSTVKAVGASTGPSVPSGYQAASFHGLQVFVPISWKIDDETCGTPLHDTVLVADESPLAACAALSRPTGLTVVTFALSDGTYGRQLQALPGHPTEIDGVPATRQAGVISAGGPTTSVQAMTVSSVDASVSVSAPTPAAATKILSSLAVVAVDSNGCSARLSSLDPPRSAGGEKLLSGTITSDTVTVSVCRYVANWVARSATVSGVKARSFARLVLNLPRQLLATNNQETGSSCTDDQQRGFIATFVAPNQSSATTAVQIGGCGDRGVQTATGSLGLSKDLVSGLVGFVGYDSGYPEP